MASRYVIICNALFLKKEEGGGLLLHGGFHYEMLRYRRHQNSFLLKNSQFQNPKSIWMLIFLGLHL